MLDSMISISGLFTYPVKSLGGITLAESPVEKRGLKFDRRWMIVDHEDVFMSQRSDTRLALFRSEFNSEGLILRNQSGDCRLVPFNPEGDRRYVRVWKDTCEAVQVSPEIDDWLSGALGQRCSLVYMPEDSLRATNPEYTSAGDIVGFADGYPILIIGGASLEDLNSRLDQAVPMNRFRPNITVSGSGPYQEDEWSEIRIGGVRLRSAKQCGRCSVTTTDQETGEVGIEPLRTLAKCRLNGQSVQFGAYFVPVETGTIRVGDQIALR
jgi:uncharacterized protein YcbX